MESCTRYAGGKRFETVIGTHRIVTDQPVSEGGADAGPTPPQLLLASLGACAGHYAAEYLRARSLSAADLEVHVTAEKSTGPARLTDFRIEVSVPGLEEKHRLGVLRAAKACLIHNTLTTGPSVTVDVQTFESVCQASF